MPRTRRRDRASDGGWSPIADRLVERVSRAGRTRALAAAGLRAGERVLLIGVGTGLDLPLLPVGVIAVGVDRSEAMLARARARLPLRGREITLVLGDAQELPVATGAFDAAVLDLILSVVPEPWRALAEALRAVRPGGRLVGYDKFLRDGARPSWMRRLANVATTRWGGTDINLRLGDLVAGQPCTVDLDEPAALRGLYRVVRLQRA